MSTSPKSTKRTAGDLLISPDYLDEMRRLHSSKRGFGGSSYKWAEVVAGIINKTGAKSVLDYGCGQATLEPAVIDVMGQTFAQKLDRWQNYDPAREEFSTLPEKPADLLICSDVLEHIEPEKIKAVLAHVRSLTAGHAFLVISLVPASKKFLSDGRNAHVLLRSREWWADQLRKVGLVPASVLVPQKRPQKEIAMVWRPA